ncbi:signal transduction histidine kinase [Kitasatospora sp. MAA4]|uniref:HAMP domain-containing sensor histidine kinase n=1 Tax=Kitasatospora sp. MAA4 TaxID=3035093 RepID=UPI0024753CEA|nr:HAMP domain-containing sensor histidine kinase [Kitasatospora sp. MAA4]MDH6135907.1 signal transduction histidine kinase [Kitasatospora sp. MAA4]
MNLRRQIATTVAVVSILLALAVGLLVHQASVRQHTEQARKSAMTALAAVIASYNKNGELPGWNSEVDDAQLPPRLHRLAEEGHQGSMLGPGPHGIAMWAAAGAGGGTGSQVFSVRVDFADDERAIADFDRSILLSAALAVAVTVLAGVLAADRISKRLRTAARTARTIAQGDLDARIGPLGGARDEVAELAAAVDSMSAVLRSKLRHEQRFTADVAHELRTPLTGLLTAAELLPPGRPTELVRNRVRVLCSLTEDLLEVSRLDARAESAELSVVPLGAVVARIVSGAGAGAGAGVGAELVVERDARVSTDVRRLDRILSNLVANAHRHGAGPVLIRVDATTVTIRDHGPGYPEDVLRDGPQRFRTGARERGHGHGLGLTIAQGHAEAIGIVLRLSNHPEGGAVAELLLPDADGGKAKGPAGERGPLSLSTRRQGCAGAGATAPGEERRLFRWL